MANVMAASFYSNFDRIIVHVTYFSFFIISIYINRFTFSKSPSIRHILHSLVSLITFSDEFLALKPAS